MTKRLNNNNAYERRKMQKNKAKWTLKKHVLQQTKYEKILDNQLKIFAPNSSFLYLTNDIYNENLTQDLVHQSTST